MINSRAASRRLPHDHPPRLRPRLTLIEAAVSTVIVAVRSSRAQAVGSAAEARRRSADLRTADDLIEWTLAEIASVYFEQPLSTGNAPWGPDPGEKSQPRDYNDIDDYHGLTMSPPIDRGGQIVSAFAGWKCDIVVLPVRAATDGWVDANAAAPLRLVEVTVRSSRGVEKLGRLLLSRQGTALRPKSIRQPHRRDEPHLPPFAHRSTRSPRRCSTLQRSHDDPHRRSVYVLVLVAATSAHRPRQRRLTRTRSSPTVSNATPCALNGPLSAHAGIAWVNQTPIGVRSSSRPIPTARRHTTHASNSPPSPAVRSANGGSMTEPADPSIPRPEPPSASSPSDAAARRNASSPPRSSRQTTQPTRSSPTPSTPRPPSASRTQTFRWSAAATLDPVRTHEPAQVHAPSFNVRAWNFSGTHVTTSSPYSSRFRTCKPLRDALGARLDIPATPSRAASAQAVGPGVNPWRHAPEGFRVTVPAGKNLIIRNRASPHHCR